MTQCDRPGDDLAGCLDKALFNGESFFIGNDIGNEQWYPTASSISAAVTAIPCSKIRITKR